MAYLDRLTPPRCRVCGRLARFQLVTRWGEAVDAYCSRHGERALAAKERSETNRRMYTSQQTRATAVSKHPQAFPFETPPSPTLPRIRMCGYDPGNTHDRENVT